MEDEQNNRGNDQNQEQEKGISLIEPKSQGKKFRVNCKSLFLTYPKNQTEPDELLRFLIDRIKRWEPLYIGVVRELHESGEPHLHAIVQLKEKCDCRDGNSYFSYPGTLGVNIGIIRSMERSIKYICKDGQPVEFGERPQPKEKCKSRKEICDIVIKEQLNQGKVDIKKIVSENPESLLYADKLVSNLRLVFEQQQSGVQVKGRRGIYIIGESGVGKSMGVREAVKKIMELDDVRGQLYLKNATNWWQGYSGQRYVLMDDIDPRNLPKVFDEFKLWSDRYAISGQTKGGSNVPLRYKCLFVTSQYGIGELGGIGLDDKELDQRLVSALSRRFFIIDIRDEGLNWQWWKQKEQLGQLTDEITLIEKRKCLQFCIMNFENKIEIEFE